MGAGKTAVGRVLARQYGIEHIDLDWRIEQRFHTKIADMFAEIGEEKFRQRERNMLYEVMQMEDVIVSVGGGTPCFFDNFEYLNSNSETVYLKAELTLIPELLAYVVIPVGYLLNLLFFAAFYYAFSAKAAKK